MINVVFRKIAAFALCASLLLAALSACSDSGMPDIDSDPAGYLQAAQKATSEEIVARYSASPLAALSGVSAEPISSTDFFISVEDASGAATFSGTAYMDTEEELFLLNTSIGGSGVELKAGLYSSPEFAGISLPFLLGSEAFYGLRPYGLVEQASGSIFDASAGGELGMDISQLQPIDDMLEAIRNSDGLSIQEMADEIASSINEIDASLQYTVSQQQVSMSGDMVDGYMVSTVYTSSQIADMMESIMHILKGSSLFTTIFTFASQTGSGTSEAEFNAQLDQLIEEMRGSGTQLTANYYIADGLVSYIEMIESQSSQTIVID